MKSARERAADIWNALPSTARVAIDLNFRGGKQGWFNAVTLSHTEAMRDQRHLCAQEINDVEPVGRDVDPSRTSCDFLNAAYAACMNAGFPGEP